MVPGCPDGLSSPRVSLLHVPQQVILRAVTPAANVAFEGIVFMTLFSMVHYHVLMVVRGAEEPFVTELARNKGSLLFESFLTGMAAQIAPAIFPGETSRAAEAIILQPSNSTGREFLLFMLERPSTMWRELTL